jgi:nucleotide-binding universal stress UspA family protein
MIGIGNILVGIDLHHGDRIATDDFSHPVLAAIEQAMTVAVAAGARVTLCAVLQMEEHVHDLLLSVHPHNLRDKVEQIARKCLDRLMQSYASRGVPMEPVIRFGSPAEELIRQAIAGKHDLVIVGTRSRNPAARLVFGSTAQKLVRDCPAPVWITKPEELRDIRELLVANDFSDASLAATRAGVAVAQAIPSKLYVVHTLEFPFEAYLRTSGVSEEEVNKYRERMRSEAEQNVQSQITQTDYRTLTYGVKIEIREGPVDTVIPQCIVDYEVDLLVIGTQGRHGISRMFLGNTAERLLPHVHCSVLAVKPPGFVSPVA